jgi:hypothetical protein
LQQQPLFARQQAGTVIAVSKYCDDTKRVFHAFVGTVPAGGVLTVERQVRLPTGGAGVSVIVLPFPPDGRKDGGIRIRPLSDKNGWDNAVETWVGARR